MPSRAHPGPSVSSTDSGLLELLTLERIEDNFFRTGVFSSEPSGLYGGQVAAHALRAGAEAVPPGRHAHSCPGSFLSRGGASPPALLVVPLAPDRGSSSNRRVIAVQHGTAIFHPTDSVHAGQKGL